MLTIPPRPGDPVPDSQSLRTPSAGENVATTTDEKADFIFLLMLFGVAVAVNVYLVTFNWHSGFLLGHEFRQTQTAIISQYIDEQNNFSIHYETPILGKPWEFPLEFPLYQWGVVWVSRLLNWPLYEAARAVGVASLYLTLPAVFLLLGQAGLPRARRLLALSLLLATPVYIFYSRSFLMDVTAMMFCAWFLAAFVQVMRTRNLGWLAVCALAGTAGALIKSLTFFVWLVPATLYGAWCLWQALRSADRWRAAVLTIGWGVSAVIIPAGAVYWWVKFTDAIKEVHSSAYIFTSQGLTKGNFGMYELSSRFSKDAWRALLECWSIGLAKPWVIALVLLSALAFFKAERWRILGAFGLFIAAQMLFPYAYAYQDYYFTACMVFAVCALGFALNGFFNCSLPRWVRWPVVVAPFAAMYLAYSGYYYPQQSIFSMGGTGLTIALRDYLPRHTVLIVAGSDWAAIIPYYSKHRALMIRNGLERDWKYLDRAFDEISDEDVAALVLVHNERGNKELREKACATFNLDSLPTFTYSNADVYVSNFYRDSVLSRLQSPPLPEGIKPPAEIAPVSVRYSEPVLVPRSRAASMFPMVAPGPAKFRFAHGYQLWQVDGKDVLNMHADSDLWVKPTRDAKEVVWQFGILPGAYEGKDKTGGVEFVVDLEGRDGRARQVFLRLLDPATNPADRGVQTVTIPITPQPDETLVFHTRPHGAYAFDWSYTMKVDVR